MVKRHRVHSHWGSDVDAGAESDVESVEEFEVEVEESVEEVEVEGSDEESDQTIQDGRLEEPSGSESSEYHDATSSVSHNESFHSTLNDSLDLEPDVPRPTRRMTRKVEAPKRMTYEELGVPVFKTRTRVKRPKNSKFKR